MGYGALASRRSLAGLGTFRSRGFAPARGIGYDGARIASLARQTYPIGKRSEHIVPGPLVDRAKRAETWT